MRLLASGIEGVVARATSVCDLDTRGLKLLSSICSMLFTETLQSSTTWCQQCTNTLAEKEWRRGRKQNDLSATQRDGFFVQMANLQSLGNNDSFGAYYVVAAGGLAQNGSVVPTTDLYNTSNQKFNSVPPMNDPRVYHQLTSLYNRTNRVVATGGVQVLPPPPHPPTPNPITTPAPLVPLPQTLPNPVNMMPFDGRTNICPWQW